jgi:hypothetical protein
MNNDDVIASKQKCILGGLMCEGIIMILFTVYDIQCTVVRGIQYTVYSISNVYLMYIILHT